MSPQFSFKNVNATVSIRCNWVLKN